MKSVRQLALRNALVLAVMVIAAFPAIAATGTELEEVIVHGKQLDVLRKEMIKAEDQFFDRYNELIDKQEYSIHCIVEQPIGSRVPRRYCRTGYEENALAQAGREAAMMMQTFLDELRREAPHSQPMTTTSVMPSSIEGRREAFRKYVKEVVIHDETLLKALVNHARLMDRYNTVYREKFGSKEDR